MPTRRNRIAASAVFSAGVLAALCGLTQAALLLWKMAAEPGFTPVEWPREQIAMHVFGAGMMVLLSVWLFFIASQLRSAFRQAFFQAVVVGFSLLFSGLGGFLYLYPDSWFYFLFILQGSVILTSVFIFFRIPSP